MLKSDCLTGSIFLLLGIAATMLLDRIVGELDLVGDEQLSMTASSARLQQKRRSALLTTLALAAHNAPEGLAVGISSLAQTEHHTLLVVAAISLVGSACLVFSFSICAQHNIPEGLAVAIAVLSATGSRFQAVAISFGTGLVEPIAAVLSVAVLSPFLTEAFLNYSLLFVGGVMLTVSGQLMPEAFVYSRQYAWAGFAAGFGLMLVTLVTLGDYDV